MKEFRTILVSALLIIISSGLRAQAPLYLGGMSLGTSLFSRPMLLGNHGPNRSAWQLYPYSAFSANFGFISGSSVSAYSLPVGLQLAHPLNDRFTAFTGVSVAPTVYSFNRSFVHQSATPGWPGAGVNNYNFNMNPRFEMGLQYTNAEKTFSISGSLSVQRGDNYYYFPAPNQATQKRR